MIRCDDLGYFNHYPTQAWPQIITVLTARSFLHAPLNATTPPP